NEEGDIYFIQGRTSPFLEPPTGHPHMNLFDMARRGLRLDLVTAVRKAAAAGSREPVRRTLEILSDDRPLTVDIEVTWLDEPDMLRGLLLVTFNAREPAAEKQPIKEEPAKKKKPLSDREQGRVQELELELQHMRESLQTTVEELETSNEELRASNEELQSTNEELQSTNEELETSKEEMQSLNEELTTVNAELQSMVDELAQVSDDMINLLNSTGVATLFLDNQLRINRFNQQATELFKLISSDVGRPISDLTSNLDYTGLVDDAKRVLETLKIIEMEIRVKDGTWRQMRLSPYRTSDNAIEGVVITFVDITELKSSARFSEEARSLADRIVQTVRIPLLILDDKLRVVTSNRAFYETFRLKPKLVEEELVYEIGGGEWDIPELRRLLGEVLSRNASFEGYQVRHDFPRIGRHVMNLNAKALIEEKNRPHLILLAIEDITAEESQP
ncbi:MAG: PAS domain-containing protein, partial [Gammaproteobacteria bacterium]